MNKTIGEVIQIDRSRFSVDRRTSVRDTVEYMHENSRAAVAIRIEDRIVGVFSEQDLLRRVVRKRLDMDTTSVSEVMSSPPRCIPLDENCQTAKAIMLRWNIHHLVVIDADQQFVGFLSSRELLETDLSDSRDLVRQLNDTYYEPRAVL